MIFNTIIFISIFIIGEFIANQTIFVYLKKYFETNKNEEKSKKFYGFDISVFKGVLERFTLYFCLSINLSQILIVYGALKIGTRIDKNEKIKNDYFLIGNFSSLLIVTSYYYVHQLLVAFF